MSVSNEHRYDLREGPLDRSLRVGDKERDAVGEILRQRHLEGRLDTDELQARLETSMAAKTYAQLDELIADFPSERAERRLPEQPWSAPWTPAFLLVPFAVLFLFLPLALVAAIVTGGHLAWVAFPLFFFVVRPLLWRGWGGGYGRGSCGCGPRHTTRG